MTIPIGDQAAGALLFVSGFALLLCACLGLLLALERVNPDLFERIEEFLFGPLPNESAAASEAFPSFTREHDGPARPTASKAGSLAQGRSAAAGPIPPDRVCAPREREARELPVPQ